MLTTFEEDHVQRNNFEKVKNTIEKFNISIRKWRNSKIDYSVIKNYTKKLLTTKDSKIQRIISKKEKVRYARKI